mgnify:CR=1 FL=1
MHIPIENIYYLLSYTWNKLDEKERVGVSIDDTTKHVDRHEDYQILGAQRLPFSDQAEARLALRELQATAHGGGDQ